MFEFRNKPEFYQFVVNHVRGKSNKDILKKTINLLNTHKLIKNTKKLETQLNSNLNFNDKPNIFLFNLSGMIYDYSRIPN